MSAANNPVPSPASLAEDLAPKKTHLVRCTYRVIGEKGLHRSSLQDIADEAGVSKGVILYYFKSKEDLILSTMRWALSRVAQRIHEAVSRAQTPHDKIRAMVDAIFIDPTANRRFYLIYLDLVDYAARSERFSKLSGEFRSIVNATYADLARLGQEQGAFRRVEVEEAAQAIRAIIDGLFIQWLQEPRWQELHEHYREMCKRSLLAYLGDQETA
jgi:AcrR family transcriptional regulator